MKNFLRSATALSATALMGMATMVAPTPAFAGDYGVGWVRGDNSIEICRESGVDCAVFFARDSRLCYDDDRFFSAAAPSAMKIPRSTSAPTMP